MKTVKPYMTSPGPSSRCPCLRPSSFFCFRFLKTFFSETLLASDEAESAEKEKHDGQAAYEPEGQWTTTGGNDNGWHAGLGQIYKYPGDPKRFGFGIRELSSRSLIVRFGTDLENDTRPSFGDSTGKVRSLGITSYLSITLNT